MDAEINTAVKRLKRIAGAPKITFEDTKILFDTLNQYFDEFERSRKFRGLENRLCGRFSEFLVYLNRDPGTYFADLFSILLHLDPRLQNDSGDNLYECGIALPKLGE